MDAIEYIGTINGRHIVKINGVNEELTVSNFQLDTQHMTFRNMTIWGVYPNVGITCTRKSHLAEIVLAHNVVAFLQEKLMRP